MKKLLALVLCVMMFVAVIPTSAFAATWADTAVSNTAIKEAEKSIKAMYTAIATDEMVFGTAKSLHDLFDGLATSMFDGVDTFDKVSLYNASSSVKSNKYNFPYHDALVDNTRAALKGVVGDSIAKYIADRADTFKSDSYNGNVDPEKYLNVFVAAVNDAVTSEKAQKGIEACIYNLFVIKTDDAMYDRLRDLWEEKNDWGFDKLLEFGTNFVTETDLIYPEEVITTAANPKVIGTANVIGGYTTATGGPLGMPLGEWP